MLPGQVADFGLSRVLEDNMTHMSTNLYGAHVNSLCGFYQWSSQCIAEQGLPAGMRPKRSSLLLEEPCCF